MPKPRSDYQACRSWGFWINFDHTTHGTWAFLHFAPIEMRSMWLEFDATSLCLAAQHQIHLVTMVNYAWIQENTYLSVAFLTFKNKIAEESHLM